MNYLFKDVARCRRFVCFTFGKDVLGLYVIFHRARRRKGYVFCPRNFSFLYTKFPFKRNASCTCNFFVRFQIGTTRCFCVNGATVLLRCGLRNDPSLHAFLRNYFQVFSILTRMFR